jgi:hypothetical protein
MAWPLLMAVDVQQPKTEKRIMMRTFEFVRIGMAVLVAGMLGCAGEIESDRATVRLELRAPHFEVDQRYAGPNANATVLRERLAAYLGGDGTGEDTTVGFRIVIEGAGLEATTDTVAVQVEEGDIGPAIESLTASLGFTLAEESQDEIGQTRQDLKKICEASACELELCECGLKTCLPACGHVYTPPGGCGYIPGCHSHCTVWFFGWCIY